MSRRKKIWIWIGAGIPGLLLVLIVAGHYRNQHALVLEFRARQNHFGNRGVDRRRGRDRIVSI